LLIRSVPCAFSEVISNIARCVPGAYTIWPVLDTLFGGGFFKLSHRDKDVSIFEEGL